ncbi:MAG TPA: arylsulfatase [Cyclobacteriaceae bacterium]|nr:arylsulfatase [Cyclobacteriaceae bacterium]
MQQYIPGLLIAAWFAITGCGSASGEKEGDRQPPNIVFILSDDLGWGDLGCYGQQKIKSPNIDRLANEGIRFTNAYAGSSVCAPSRSSLMQGLHQGHARVRGNAYRGYRESLQKGDFTVAMLLKEAGYKTGLFGKWGLALHDQPGIPNNMGFDEFYGYLNQQQAHTYYPEFLYHNTEREYFPGNKYHFERENYAKASPYDEQGRVLPNGIADPSGARYSFDVISEKSLEFVREHKDVPFFLYLAHTMPHGPLIVPDLGEYKDKDWPIQHKEWAAMIGRMDAEVGKLLALLEELQLDDNTLIVFASDNGNHEGYENRYMNDGEAPSFSEFFGNSSPTRGKKGNEYDGGFRVPAMARWPAQIAPNQVSDHIWAFWDFLPTVAATVSLDAPAGTDGISILPTLTGQGEQEQHEYLYWEHNQNQAVRMGNWYAHRANGGSIELYDLLADPQQSRDISSSYPETVEKVATIMTGAHTPSDVWPSPGESREAFQARLSKQNIPVRTNNLGLY